MVDLEFHNAHRTSTGEIRVTQTASNSLSVLIDTARRAARAGRVDEAARAWEQVRASAPDNPEALAFFGHRALAQGDARGAADWLARAARAAPKDAIIPLALANAHRALGDTRSELAALEAALKADPYCYPALLAKGALLERSGRQRQAASIYADALKITPAEERLSADLQGLVRRARESVSANIEAFDAFLEARLGNLRRAHERERLDRFDETKDVLVGRRRVYTQQPVMLHVPQLPAIQFYDDTQFPWLSDLEAATDTIEGELQALLEDQRPADFRPYLNHGDGVPLNAIAPLNRSTDWSAYFLWDDGNRIDDHCSKCPRTAALLERLPMADIPGFAPAAFFSMLAPHTAIASHTGVTNARLIVHLGLTVPDRCTFRVGNETRQWRRGKAWVFDDTIEHEARNDSAERRVLLIFDIWNPYLTAAERELVCALLAARREYYENELPRS